MTRRSRSFCLLRLPHAVFPVRRALLSFLIATLFMLVMLSPAQAAVFTKPFTLYADQQPLSAVLNAFARAQGYNPYVSPALTGSVSGNFTNVPPMGFLDGMQNAFNVNWYTLGNEINFYHSAERDRAYIIPKAGDAATLYSALSKSGVFAPELPAQLNKPGNSIAVSGPQRYLNQIRAAANAWETALTDKIIMKVFPLKYAWAQDIEVTSMDKTVTIPGVASILQAMVLGTSVNGTQVTQEKATVNKLSGQGLAAQGKQQDRPGETSSASSITSGSVSIIADPRVNAVVVSDAAYRMDYYGRVIADLDKPVKLIEIHAAVVDIDTEFTRTLGINLLGGRITTNGWSGAGTMGGSSSAGLTSASTSSTPASDAGAAITTIYNYGADFFMARIKALEQDNVARVLGRPSVLTIDNVQATLENTTTYHVSVAGYQTTDLYKVEAGTILRVTPHIVQENGKTAIKLVVSVQDETTDSNASNSSRTSGSSSYQYAVPPVKQTKINTQAVVGAGQSLLIGGYYYEKKGNESNGVPWISNVPFLGHLFSDKTKSSKRMERLILITPRIVAPNERNVPAQADDPSFRKSPVQANYEYRTPVKREPVGSACGRRRPSSELPAGDR